LNDEVRDILARLVAQYGQELCTDRQRVEGLLRDLCGQHRREIGVLVSAVREGVAQELRGAPGTEVDALVFHRLVQKLDHNAGIAEDYARWALTTWAEALGRQAPAVVLGGAREGEAPAEPLSRATPPSQVETPRRSVLQRVRDLLPGLEPQGGRGSSRAAPTTNGSAGGRGSPRAAPTTGGSAGASPSQAARAGGEWTNPIDGAVMLHIPAGEFLMGSNDYAEEKPQHRRVHLDAYWIYKYPVTVAQYRKFCGSTRREMPEEPKWGWREDHPVVNVSWDDAKAYADWAGVALPTEAQWEKAARGTDGRTFPWGNVWDPSKCNNDVGDKGPKRTTVVGNYPDGTSPYGVLDMAGNVGEWCGDWYDAGYYDAPRRNPTGPPSGGKFVLRGGSWLNLDPTFFRCADRTTFDVPGYRSVYIGFRCALSRPDSS